jgi:hypothetical protein
MTSNSRYSMLDSMDIRCARCGYENNPQFRFCGMCGAALRPRDPEQRGDHIEDGMSEGEIISKRLREEADASPEPMPVEPLIAELTAAQKHQAESARTYSRESREEAHSPESFHGQRTPVPVTGLSFLGLSDNADDRRVEYLLEDEPHPGRKRTIVGLFLLLAICAGGIFYWRKAGYPLPSGLTAARSNTASSDTSAQNTNPAPSEVAPPVEDRQIPQKPKTGVEDTSLQPSANDGASPPTAAAEQNNNGGSKAPTDATPGTKETSAGTETSEPASLPSARKPTPSRAAELSKPKSSKPSPVLAAAPNPAEDSLFLEGQKYLYGSRGVSANCAKAQQYLATAANNNNSKAQSTLGTMYATGHCARRDLPLAYRWFARALREDPRNTRLVRDVQIMWDQMSPQERNVALKNE